MIANQRVAKGATDTLTALFYDGGESAIDKGAVTVTVRGDLGTVLAGPTAATNTAGTYTYTLPTTATAAIDRLTVSWVSATQTLTTFVEIVGGFYFDLADLRAMQDLGTQSIFPTSALRRARRWIEDIIDKEVRSPFVRRYYRDVFALTSMGLGVLYQANAKALLSMSVSSVALTSTELAALSIDNANRIVTTASGWRPVFYTYGSADIRYEAALFDSCPGDLREAALQAARFRLISTDGQSGIPSRATSITNDLGNIQLSTASAGKRPTGIPDVDAVIMNYADRYRIPGIA